MPVTDTNPNIFSNRADLDTAINEWISDEVSAKATYGDINTWNVSQITDFSELFYNKINFNSDISSWDVSNGTDFSYMFDNADAFNQDIGSWDVSNGTNFEMMFFSAEAFNQDIGSWDVSSGNNFWGMFRATNSFNQDLGSWDVSNGTDFKWMFARTGVFNQDISRWDVSSGTDFNSMFLEAKVFNQDISSWDVSNGNNFMWMFKWDPGNETDNNYAFNQDISSWNIKSDAVLTEMFENASNMLGRGWSSTPSADDFLAVGGLIPTLTTSEISDDGSKLILTFSENIFLAAGATFSALQVTVDGSTNNPVTAVNTANAELQATLSDKILNGQQITFDYLSSAQIIQDSNGNYLDTVSSQSVSNLSNVIGYVNGSAYEGDFHVMDGGMKMTGASHGAGTDQIIYSSIAESMPGTGESVASTWSYKYEGVLSLIENKTWSDDTNATVKPLEIDSDSSGNLYILGSVTKPNNSGPMGMGEDFLGNTLTVLTSTGTHTRTIEILNSDDGKSYLNSHREHLATSSNGTTLVNTNKKAILIDSQSNITTLIDEPLVANQWEYVDQLQSASFYDGSFYLQHGGNILRYSETGVLQETINSGWDNVGANTSGNGIQFDVGQDIIAVAENRQYQGGYGVNNGYFYVLEKNNGDWVQSTAIQVGHTALAAKIDHSENSVYVIGEGPSAGDGYLAKFEKDSQGNWSQSWFSSDSDSYLFNKLDITSNSQILIAGRTGSGGYSAAYDADSNQTERLMDDSSEVKASIDHATSSNGTRSIISITRSSISRSIINIPCSCIPCSSIFCSSIFCRGTRSITLRKIRSLIIYITITRPY